MIYLYRTGFVILTVLIIFGTLLPHGRSAADSIALRLRDNPAGWNFVFSDFDSRLTPDTAKKKLIEYIERKSRTPDPLDLFMLSCSIAAFFCLIGWIREARIAKQLKARAISN